MTATAEELRRGMEPFPLERASKEEAVTHFSKGMPGHLLSQVKSILEKMFDDLWSTSEADGEVWICASRYRGPMAGHEGLGLVRNGEVVKYQVIRRF